MRVTSAGAVLGAVGVVLGAFTPAWAADPARTPLSTPARATVVYGKENAPAAPALEDLPQKESLTQYGITWTFEKPVRVGQFVGGDYYVVGPVVVSVSPKPLFGNDVTDATDAERKYYAGSVARNGSVLNLSATGLPAFDSRVQGHRYDPKNFARFPLAIKPGDVLISTISVATPRAQERMMGPSDHKNVSTVQTAAVLTCVAEPVAPDAFRPSYCDPERKLYFARNLKRELLPRLAPPASAPQVAYMTRVFERPWIDTVFFGFASPVDNLPQYGREVARAAGMGTLLLCCDYDEATKERLLQGIVQAGVDYWGAIRAGHPGYQAHGGHGSGRKWILVFSGILLGDADMQNPYAKFPNVKFGEDMQTVYGDGWTGAKALYAGHVGAQGRPDILDDHGQSRSGSDVPVVGLDQVVPLHLGRPGGHGDHGIGTSLGRLLGKGDCACLARVRHTDHHWDTARDALHGRAHALHALREGDDGVLAGHHRPDETVRPSSHDPVALVLQVVEDQVSILIERGLWDGIDPSERVTH